MSPRPSPNETSHHTSVLARFVVNAASMVTSEVVVRATSFLAYAIVGRMLGAYAFAQLSLGLTLVYTFQIMASAGQRTLMVREIARRPAELGHQLGAAARIVGVGSVAVLLPLAALVAVAGWDRSTVVVILVMFTALPAYALSQVLEGMMQGLEQMRFVAAVNVPVHLLKAAAVAGLLATGGGILGVAVAMSLSYWVVLAAELTVLWRRLLPLARSGEPIPGPAVRGWPAAAANARRGGSFLGVELVFAVTSAIPLLVVSTLAGETAAGIFGAAQQAVIPLSLAVNSLVGVTFPAMSRTFDRSTERTRVVVVTMVESILALVMPFICLVSAFAPEVIHLLYGNDDLTPAGGLLRIVVWWSIVNVIGTVMGQSLWALDREAQSMQIGAWTAVVSLVSNGALVAAYGLDGVVPALLAVGLAILVLHYRKLAGLVSLRHLAGAVWRPALATGIQLLSLLALRAELSAVPAAAISLAAFAAVLGSVTRLTTRGAGADRRPLTALVASLSGS